VAKIFAAIGVVSLAAVFVFGLANLGSASMVWYPENETHLIQTDASVKVTSGNMTETERYHVRANWLPAYVPPDDFFEYRVIDYSEDLRVVESNATLDKKYKSHTGEVPNLTVTKDFSSEAVGLAGYGRNKEKVGLINVQVPFWGWGWCTHCPAQVLEACEAVAMGSSVAAPVVVSHTDSEATVLGDPDMDVPMVSHKIDAHVEDGTVTAGMRADFIEGPIFGWGGPDSVPTTREFYEEHTTGSGLVVDFKKSMKYQSVIKKAMLPMPWDRLGF